MPRPPIRTRPVPEWLPSGPWRGVRDAQEPTAHDPAFLLQSLNVYRRPGTAGGAYVGRPGWARMGATALGTVVQGVIAWTNASGVVIRCAVVDGALQTYDPGTNAWTVAVTTANLTTASVTLATTGKVALVPFAGKLMVSDGVNPLITWDGTAGAGGIAQIASVGPFYGPLVVYYAKLFGIKASARNTLLWSEENDPTLGYDVGGYNNAWDNPGGQTAPLHALAATNEALYVFRERFSIAITGAVNDDFQTAGTRANLSEEIGTVSPWAVQVIPQGVAVVDADGKPYLFRYGTPPTPLWADCWETVQGMPRAALPTALSGIEWQTQTLAFGVPDVGQTKPTRWLVFSLEDLQFMGVWRWAITADCAGPWITAAGARRWAHAGTDGAVYQHGCTDTGPWNDALLAGAAYIQHEVTTGSLGYGIDRELHVDQIEAGLAAVDVSNVAVSYETPRGTSLPLNVDTTAVTGGLQWDVDDWDEANWASASRDRRFRVGVAGRGRWVRVSLRHAEDAEQFGALMIRARCTATDGHPSVP